MSATSVVSCPHCKGQIVADPSLAGRNVGCPHCDGRLVMPGAAPVRAARTAQSPAPVPQSAPVAAAPWDWDFPDQPDSPGSPKTSYRPQPHHVVVTSTKSVGIAILLTVLFGPLGMLYSTVVGGLIMLVVTPIFAFITLGFGLLLTWPICIVWAALAVSSHNSKLLAGANRYRR